MNPRRPATLEDVAQMAGVSRATVSRVVRGDPVVAQETITKVLEAVKELGYVPNGAAQFLVTGQSTTLAMVVPEPDQRVFSDPFFAKVVSGISSGMDGTNMQLVMVFAPGRGRPDQTVQFLRDGRVAGALVVSHHRADGLIDAAATLPIPTVFVGKPFRAPSRGQMPHFVDTDNVKGGRLAALRMIETGVRNPALIAGPRDMTASVDRLEGWLSIARPNGLKHYLARGDFTAESGASAARLLLDRHPDIDGIFAFSDLMAMGAAEVMADRGISIGDQVKLIGFDNVEAAKGCQPALTTVDNPAFELGRRATELVLRLADQPAEPSAELLDVGLVARDSG